jgi:pimeloyl-ACP methyl ester carboxylesterase
MSSTASNQPQAETIVLVHGMWMTPLSWEHWIDHYTDRGHRVLAPAWPGLDKEPEELRRDPSPLRGIGIKEVVDHYDKIIRGLDRPPIIMGHSFGGLFAQLLLDRGLGSAGVALGTGAPKGVLRLPLSTLRAAWPALNNPANLKKETPLSPKQFHWCFTNALSRDESDAVYRRYYIPGSARPFFQAGLANLNPNAATKVTYKNPSRAPLLLVTGTEDRICPPSVNESNFKQQRKAPSATEHREYPGRSHWPGQDGWEELADYMLNWTTEHARTGAVSPAEAAPERAATSPA